MGVSDRRTTSVELNPMQMAGWFGTETIMLRDDGIAPDERARDAIFTGGLRLTNPPARPFVEQIIRNLKFTLHLPGGINQEVTEDVASAIGVIDSLRSLSVISGGPELARTNLVVNFIRPDLLTGSYPFIGVDTLNTLRLFYQGFPDNFDWIVLFQLYNNRAAPAGSYGGVKNAVRGIAQRLFDNTVGFGSTGRLRGYVNLFFKSGSPLTHEIFHIWGAIGFDAIGLVSSAGGGGHWGALANATNSTVFGFPPTLRELARNERGNFCGAFGSGPILGLELYLMGLAPATAIGANLYVTNSAFVASGCGGYEFSGTQLATLDQNRMISAFGPRSPAFPDQSSFRAAVVVVSNRALTPPEWDYVSRVFEDHAKRFPNDYAGRAQISYQIQN